MHMKPSPDSKILSSHTSNNRSLHVISWVSYFWSASTLMVLSILPSYLTDVLHISKTKIGLIEGTAIGIAFLSKVVTGLLSDYFKARKPLIVIGSICSVLIKPLFALANSTSTIFMARFIDRLGKGIRSAPTDALIADISSENKRGFFYGLRQMLYVLGEVSGAGLAIIFMVYTQHNYQIVFGLSTFVGFIALVYLLVGLKESPRSVQSVQNIQWHWSQITQLPTHYWYLLGALSILMVARFSEIFLGLRAQEMGWHTHSLPAFFAIVGSVHGLSAYPIGRYSDRVSKRTLLLQGITCLFIANGIFLIGNSLWASYVGIVFVGLHLGITQGLMRSMLIQSIPFELRGTAFALFYLTSGVAIFIGNWITGILSDQYGVCWSFAFGAMVTILALICTVGYVEPHKSTHI